MHGVDVAKLGAEQLRRAGKDLLSLALIDARNLSLRWLAAFESAADGAALRVPEGSRAAPSAPDSARSALWASGHLGWFQEHWIARNVERQRGARCDATRPKLASILPEADAWFDPASAARDALPDPQTVRLYLVDSLEVTLELLEGASDDDDALYFYRLALRHEDACAERFAVLAQALGLELGVLAASQTGPQRPPLWFPSTRWRLGAEPGDGFVPDTEQWAHEVALPEFEIDAQAVSWSQFGEFVEDGGYDDRGHWDEAGWAWVQAQGRRSPRYVDQVRQGVLLQRFGRLVRAPLAQPVAHVAWHEAQAWCRWAGRRLPHESEWEAAAILGATRGHRWGEVREWTAGTLRPYPGWPHADFSRPSPGQPSAPAGLRVLRGASFATHARRRDPKARDSAAAERDDGFFGFRSCAV